VKDEANAGNPQFRRHFPEEQDLFIIMGMMILRYVTLPCCAMNTVEPVMQKIRGQSCRFWLLTKSAEKTLQASIRFKTTEVSEVREMLRWTLRFRVSLQTASRFRYYSPIQSGKYDIFDGGEHFPQECVLVSFPSILRKTHFS
jgi:hypothetical protein